MKRKEKKKETPQRSDERFSIPDTPENVARAMFGIKRKPTKKKVEKEFDIVNNKREP